MRLIFAGSGPFGAAVLDALLRGPREVAAVLSRPDRPAGRGRRLRPTPVSERAAAAGLPLLRPERLDGAARAELAALGADVLAVADYGRLLPADWLGLCPGGCLNVHASLLPRWRGAAPVARAIEAGDAEGGCTLMLMDAGLDTGDILLQRARPFAAGETAGEAAAALAPLGAALLLRYLEDFDPAHPGRRPQDGARATAAPLLRKAEAAVDWRRPAAEIARRIRAFNPRPGAAARCGSETLRLWRADAGAAAPGGPPGTVVGCGADGLRVAAGDGQVRVTELQRPGRRRLPAAAFCRGGDWVGRRFA